MHEVAGECRAEGRASVERGTGLLAHAIAAVIGFPRAGRDVPVTVTFRCADGMETWRRTFAGRSFASTQEQGRGRFAGLVCERFGPVAVGFALVLDHGRMRLVLRRWSLFGLPMPRAWAPRADAYEAVEDGRFRFHVAIGHPWTGLIVRYVGWLEPTAPAPACRGRG
jgi:hypothetical protein